MVWITLGETEVENCGNCGQIPVRTCGLCILLNIGQRVKGSPRFCLKKIHDMSRKVCFCLPETAA